MKRILPVVILLWGLGMIGGEVFAGTLDQTETDTPTQVLPAKETPAARAASPIGGEEPSTGQYLLASAIFDGGASTDAFGPSRGQTVQTLQSEYRASIESTRYDVSIVALVTGIFSGAESSQPERVAIPEPGSIFLLGTGLFGIAGMWRRRARKS